MATKLTYVIFLANQRKELLEEKKHLEDIEALIKDETNAQVSVPHTPYSGNTFETFNINTSELRQLIEHLIEQLENKIGDIGRTLEAMGITV